VIAPVLLEKLMAMNQAILAEFDKEIESTRRTLERIPDDTLGWKPHEKSGTMAWLASHVANLPMWVTVTMTTEVLDFAAPPDPKMPSPKEAKSAKELVEFLDTNAKNARAAIAAASDSDLMKSWTLKQGDKTFFTIPKVAVLRSFVLNHLIHHRGQLTMYMRLKNIPVPALYGPSADENPWA
jgi:uncharacterized damage-inducible protein DinB